MATTKDTPYPGARETLPGIGTSALVNGKGWRKAEKDLEAAKYKPDPNKPQPKGRAPRETIPTSLVQADNHHEAEQKKAEKYQGQDLPYKVGPRHKPAKSTFDAEKQIQQKIEDEKAEEKAQQQAAQKRRDDYLATVQAQADGTFKPPENPPENLAQLKKTKDPAADPTSVTISGKKYTWTKAGGGWKAA